jgi:hypothetical protein
MKVTGLGCFLMLHPVDKNSSGAKMWLEFIGDAEASTNNRCAPVSLVQ